MPTTDLTGGADAVGVDDGAAAAGGRPVRGHVRGELILAQQSWKKTVSTVSTFVKFNFFANAPKTIHIHTFCS
jgi:hypothetical protein